jgi:hypothetical protein
MPKTKNHGLLGGTLDATKHVELARDPAAYMRRLAERPWMAYHNSPRKPTVLCSTNPN